MSYSDDGDAGLAGSDDSLLVVSCLQLDNPVADGRVKVVVTPDVLLHCRAQLHAFTYHHSILYRTVLPSLTASLIHTFSRHRCTHVQLYIDVRSHVDSSSTHSNVRATFLVTV